MEQLLQRFDALPAYIKTWNVAKIAEFHEKKISSEKEPNKNLANAFEKKIQLCEKKVKENEPFLAQLIEKKRYFESIKYDEENASKDFLRTYTAVQKRLAEYEWDGETLIKGNPTKTNVDKINTTHLKDTLAKMNPKPKGAEAFIEACNEGIKENRPLLQKAGLGDKLEEWNSLVDQLRQGDTTVMGGIEALYREFQARIPEKKKPNWKKVRESYLERAKYADAATKKMGSPYMVLDDKFQEAYEAKNDGKMDKLFKKIDKLLPKEGTYKKSVLSTVVVAEDEVLGTSYSSDEAVVDDDDDDAINSVFSDSDEEPDYSSSDSDHATKPKKRDRDMLGEVLETFAPSNDHIQSLRDIYVKDDMDAFASQLKKIKQTSVDRWKVEIWGLKTDVLIPSLPGESYFLSEKDAQQAGDNYLRMFALKGDYEKRIIHLPAGTQENKNEDV